jgi:hypothetical protein
MVDLYPHQRDAVRRLRNGSILWGGVGSGKSRTAMAYYMEKEAPRELFVITTAKKRDSLDWIGEGARFGILTDEPTVLAGQLTVDSWNNVGKYENVEEAFFIFDEQRLVGSGAWVKSFLKIANKNRWILLSATPGDTWLDYIPVFVANGYFKNRTQFLREHVVFNRFSKYPKVERFVNEGKLNRYRSEILVHMPYKSSADAYEHQIKVHCDATLYKMVMKNRWNPYKEAPVKTISELFYVARRVLNSDPSRLEAVHNLLKKHPRMVIFYNFDYELEILRTLGEEFPLAEWNGHKHEAIPDDERWVYLVQYTSGAEGWNCTETNAVCFYSLTYSYRAHKQSFGRIDRMDTLYDILYGYVLVSDAPLDRAILSALKAKKNFNEANFM